MAKPKVITLPFVLLLWDYWPLRRMFAGTGDTAPEGIPSALAIPPRTLSWLILEKLPLLALSAGSAVLTLKAQRAGGAINPQNSFGLSMRVENAVVSYARYMGKAVWPLHLSAFYPYPRGGVSTWQAIASCVLLTAVTVFVIVARQRRYLLVGWLWFLGTLVPMIGVVQAGDQSIADRYAYLPFVGLFIMVCWGGADLASKIKSRAGAAVWSAAPSLAIVLALTVVTHRQIGIGKTASRCGPMPCRSQRGTTRQKPIWARLCCGRQTPKLRYLTFKGHRYLSGGSQAIPVSGLCRAAGWRSAGSDRTISKSAGSTRTMGRPLRTFVRFRWRVWPLPIAFSETRRAPSNARGRH